MSFTSTTRRLSTFNVGAAPVTVGAMGLLLLLPGCEKPDGRVGRVDCATWAGTRYCFPATVLGGLGSDAKQMSGIVYVPLTSPELRKCNAKFTELTSMVQDYDNVDVLMTSLWKGQTSKWLYETIIKNQISKVPLGWNEFTGPRCYKNRPGATDGVTCIEREKATKAVHVTSCDPREKPEVPACFDTYIKDRVSRQIFYQRGCYPHRSAMRARVNIYIQDHSRN